ncbi:hypothetical protein CSOJ01_09918 [Colletotrichum sojae]|uniref:Uncharacterized protein n=1 Tax=Colletotrichum sojae TaxID=2175907 RepID=A0A8H6J1K9_9PEZI|nr:hypothetical protein CSOJ01_09918 [Colletotrichum sojae]
MCCLAGTLPGLMSSLHRPSVKAFYQNHSLSSSQRLSIVRKARLRGTVDDLQPLEAFTAGAFGWGHSNRTGVPTMHRHRAPKHSESATSAQILRQASPPEREGLVEVPHWLSDSRFHV